MKNEIRAILAAHAKLPVAIDTLADDADLYRAGLTSFASVQVMLALEEAFDIEFPEQLLNRRTFSSIAAMEDAVSQISTAAAA